MVWEVLGLDREAESVYRLMLDNPGWGLPRLAAELGTEPASVAAVLDRLADLALLRPSLADPGVLRPIPPDLALDAAFARRQADLARRQQEIEEQRAAVAGMFADYSSLRIGRQSGGVERVVGLDAIRSRLEELAFRARRESLAFAPGGAQTEENRAAGLPLAEAVLARGVRLKTVYLDSVANDPGSRDHAAHLASLGAETRTVPSLPLRMQIVDRETVVAPLDPQDSSQGAVIIREPGAVAGLVALFDQVWATARPLGAPAITAPEEVVDAQEAALLKLLAEGLTDEAAARRLGVSLRTERRMITELSNRLSAGSRFQLGQRAAELGIL
ncbi:helix-turn-helix transcriptional regulator [Streptomyces venezuelae]|uniref:Helix-turn-helix transcriptional regulator n=1 Tax=Streptomyces venezuelae TaxID=54571 RepID=A0A5P2DAY4_STRVZ|nr:helix-turn-helix transcriptional regulator [Streptomyces venezuelae]QES51903.1 helix-turn-helix transcriptional regulator [Streptomyces venezuelae]